MPRKISIKKCLICGDEFTTRTTRQTCSRPCQNKLPKDYLRVCTICGKEFYSHKPNGKACSGECRKIHNNKLVEKSHSRNPEARKMMQRNSTRKCRSNFSEDRKRQELLKNYAWREKNPERWKELKKQSSARHPKTAKIAHWKRKSLVRNAGEFPDKVDIEKRLNLFEGCCYCQTTTVKKTVEHLVPIVKGGTSSMWNLFGSCSKCNSSKGGRDFLTWFRRQSFYDPYQEYKILQETLAG